MLMIVIGNVYPFGICYVSAIISIFLWVETLIANVLVVNFRNKKKERVLKKYVYVAVSSLVSEILRVGSIVCSCKQ